MRVSTAIGAVAVLVMALAGCDKDGGSTTPTATPDHTSASSAASASKPPSPGLLSAQPENGPVKGLTPLVNNSRDCAQGYTKVEIPIVTTEKDWKYADGAATSLSGTDQLSVFMKPGPSDRRIIAVVVNGHVGAAVSDKSKQFALSKRDFGSDANGNILSVFGCYYK